MPKKAWLILAITLLIGVGVWKVSKDYRPGIQEGNPALDFTLQDQVGKKISLSSLRGKVVLLNFWASWCGPCLSEMGSLDKLYQKLKGQPFEILAVSLDEEGWKAIGEFLKKTPVTFPILLDADFKTSEQYGTYRLPETYLITPKGQISEKIVGPQAWDDPHWVQKIQALYSDKK
jgi:peroxiredoxin